MAKKIHLNHFMSNKNYIVLDVGIQALSHITTKLKDNYGAQINI